jgi:hypothetical protein
LARLLIVLVLLLTGCAGQAADAGRGGPDPAGPSRTGNTAAPQLAGGAARSLTVTDADALTRALAQARPGDRITLAPGTYEGRFLITRAGTREQPITVTGPREAVIDGGGIRGGRALTLQADWWQLAGFTIRNGQKGLMAEHANHTVVAGLAVYDIGDEAIHFQHGSSDNLIRNCVVHDTGKRRPGFGEGIYLGSANSNWPGGQPDRSDRNRVVSNHLGPNIAAEPIDIKEGTTGGEIRDNTFDGRGQTGENSAESWVNAKGNGYTIAANRGAAAYLSGFKARTVRPGWGCGNTFRANSGSVAPTSKPGGYAFDVANQADCADAPNRVCDDNHVTGAPLSQLPPARC